MSNTQKKKAPQKVKEKQVGTIDTRIGKYGNDPYFIKKAAEAKAFIDKHGLPEQVKTLK